MVKCEKRCLANVDGQCAVENCSGPIIRVAHSVNLPMDQAAKMYVISREAFKTCFGQEDDDGKV